MEAANREQREFFDLAERFRGATDPAEVERLGDQLGRMGLRRLMPTRPEAREVSVSDDELTVSVADGRKISVPLAWFPGLLHATGDQRRNFEILGDGEGIHWPDVDEDPSVAGLLGGTV